MHLGPLRMQLRAAISFFLLFGTNSSPEKVQHFLVSPNSINIARNALFFGAATGAEVPLCWGRCTKISTFLRDLPHPSENGNIHLIDRIADFLHNKLFFLIAPSDLHFLGPLGSIFSAPEHVQHPFLASGNAPKWCFFLKDLTHREFLVLLHKRNFFRMVPKGLNAFGTFAHAAESGN